MEKTRDTVMATNLTHQNELAEFHRFLSEKITNGGCSLSPEEVLDEWRADHPSSEEFAASVVAVRQALADMDRGDLGRPADEVIAEIRRRIETTPKT
jgi:hypothetical protein